MLKWLRILWEKITEGFDDRGDKDRAFMERAKAPVDDSSGKRG